jgi:polyphosphate kinase 2
MMKTLKTKTKANGKSGVDSDIKFIQAKKKSPHGDIAAKYADKLSRSDYEKHLNKLGIELVKLQEWVKLKKLKVVVIFEGRDAAGKGGVIKVIDQFMNPRICKVVALGVPTEKEREQWYFQRYVSELPTGGEITLFDRSWYNRAGVEHVMGFCTKDEYEEFLRACPEFEKMLIRSGIILIKYWFSVSNKEQEKRFLGRIENPIKRWKISPMDIESRNKWVEFSVAKDEMFAFTDTKQSPWFVVEADDKKRARLNCISHLLSMIPYEQLPEKKFKLPPRKPEKHYVRPPKQEQNFVPNLF